MAISGDDWRRAPDPDPPDSPSTETSPPWGGEPLDDIRPPLRADGLATPQATARLRHELATWLALNVPDEPLEDLVLTTYEAIANAAEHAYADHTDAADHFTSVLAAPATASSSPSPTRANGKLRSGRASAPAASP